LYDHQENWRFDCGGEFEGAAHAVGSRSPQLKAMVLMKSLILPRIITLLGFTTLLKNLFQFILGLAQAPLSSF
jgi:hypothetical protein